MPSGALRFLVYFFVLAGIVLPAACGGVLKKEYEYEEELYLSLDGSATVNINASVAALVALRGADLDVNPRARLDRARIRALFGGPGMAPARMSDYRRNGRRFIYVSIDVTDVRRLAQLAPFAWSTYEFERRGGVFEYRQVLGRAAGKPVGDVGWDG